MDTKKRALMELEADGYIKTQRVAKAFAAIPREEFVPESQQSLSYEDRPLPIGEGQTISAPSMVAVMTELLEPQPGDTVLEVGCGSGYQAAILSKLVKKVYAIELEAKLASRARETLHSLGITNVEVIQGDGSQGLSASATFDKILVSCACKEIPEALKGQLKEGGILVAPVGSSFAQELTLLRKKSKGFRKESHGGVVFVPMRSQNKQ